MLLENRVLSYQTAFSTTLTASPSVQLTVVDSGDITGGGIPAFPLFGEIITGNGGLIFPVASLTLGTGEITLTNTTSGTNLSFIGDNSILLYDRLDNAHDFTEVAIEFTDASGFTATDVGVSTDEIVLDLTDVTLDAGETILLSVGFAENNAPVFTSDAAASVTENTLAVLDLAADDADDDTVTYSVTGGADAALFEITAGNQLAFVAAPDFEAPSSDGGGNSYSVEVTADDGWEGRTVQSVVVTVTDANEQPTAIDDADDEVRTDEDGLTGNLVATLLANDTDPDGDSLRIVAVDTGTTQGSVSFDAVAQTLVYDPNGAFAALREGQTAVDEFTYTVSDGEFTATATVSVTVDGVDTDPVEIVGTPGKDTLSDLVGVANIIWGDQLGTLLGRGGDDRIYGRGGDDQISGDAATIGATGRGGNDLIQGGDGSDTIYGDATGTIYGIGGNDELVQGAGSGLLVGDGLALDGRAKGGHDRLLGIGGVTGDSEEISIFVVRPPNAGLYGDAATTMSGFSVGGTTSSTAAAGSTGSLLFGDARELSEVARGGKDKLQGSTLDDTLTGDAELLGGNSRGGNDQVAGNNGNDRLFGDGASLIESARGGNDVLRGGGGDDVIYGDAVDLMGEAVGGDDWIDGGSGDDQIWGDGVLADEAQGGVDRFRFTGSFGDDTINDFTASKDTLVFAGYEESDVVITVVGTDTVLSALGDNSVTLKDYTGSLAFGSDLVFI